MEHTSEVFTAEQAERISREYKRLNGNCYLDHAGASLYSDTLLNNVTKDLAENLYLNPHTSKYTNDRIDQIRFRIQKHFNSDADNYDVVFTSGATAALKLVAESYEFLNNNESDRGLFLYLQDNHTSVLGMRDCAISNGADVLCITREELFDALRNYDPNSKINNQGKARKALFVYPAQCNFSGYKYPLEWIDYIKRGALNRYVEEKTGKSFTEWNVLLDAAALVATSNLNLTVYRPNFVCISFYKIFGYPTGLGALLVEKESANLLKNKKYYGGGTVEIAMSKVNYHVKRESIYERFEDGTIPFLSILSLKHGFDSLETIIGRDFMDKISSHTFNLSRTLYHKLKSIRHPNGEPLVKLYADSDYDNINIQGGIVNFNILRASGEYVGYSEVTHMAQLFDISIRSGCFCNPGACQRHLNLSNDELLNHHKAGHKCGDDNDLINGVPTGSLRASFGYMSTMGDVDSFVEMLYKCFVEKPPKILPNYYFPKTTPNSNIESNVLNEQFVVKGIIKAIHLYPIKSCASFNVNGSWQLGTKGLKYDREWMIITENGTPLTQKQDTRMCLIQPSINIEKDQMKLSFPGVDDIYVSLKKSPKAYKAPVCQSKICNDRVQGYDCGDNVADWLTDVLGLPGVRLIRQANNDRIAKQKSNNNSTLSLTNQAQYLLVNLSSIKWLAERITSNEFNDNIENLTCRFRGNLIIDVDKEFDEFSWECVKIGSVLFQVEGPCTRCQMICIDQETGIKTTEPLRTISKVFRGKLHFGVYLSCYNPSSEEYLSCGDEVSIPRKLII